MSEQFVERNKAEFLRLYQAYVHREGSKELLSYLESTDFFLAPASKKNHMAVPGGLCFHSINVAKTLLQLMFAPGTYWNWYAVARGITAESCVIVGLLHDLCKIGFYKVSTKMLPERDPNIVAEAKANRETIKQDKDGEFVWREKPYYDIEDEDPMGHGENSYIRILEHSSMKLTLDEKLAIRWHMGFTVPKETWGTLNDAMDISPFVMAANFADITATHLLEAEENTKTIMKGRQMYLQKHANNQNHTAQTPGNANNTSNQNKVRPMTQPQDQTETQTTASSAWGVNSFEQMARQGNAFNMTEDPFKNK